jgi:hypothetical protein
MSEITVASTTDTQRAIDLAAGLSPETAMEETGQTAAEQQEPESFSGTEDASEQEAVAEASAPPPESRTQKQIEALTQRTQEQQEELEALRSQVTGYREQGTRERGQAGNNGRPTPTQYGSHEEFIEALADWKAGQLLQQQRQAELVQAEQARAREIFDTYNQAANSARAKYPDFEKVVGRRDLKIPQAAQIAIIEAGNSGPDIAYYLGKHPEMCRELTEMSPMRAIARVGQIEAELQGSQESEARSQNSIAGGQSGRGGRGGQSATATSITRKAPPAPITPVGGSSSRSSVPMGELPYRDYKRLREQEERRNK